MSEVRIEVITGNKNPAGWTPVYITAESLGPANELLDALNERFESIIGDKAALIRVAPVVGSQKDFERDVLIHKGYARFMLSDKPGKRETFVRPLSGEVSLFGFR